MELTSMIHELAPRVVAYCRALTRDPVVAEDAAQDALMALVRHWRRRGAPRSPAAFVFAVARRRALRAAMRRRLLSPFVDAETADGGSSPQVEAEQRSDLAHVLAGLARLPRRDRHALLLVAVAELAYPEAAAILGVSLPAFKMRVHRARRRLAAQLDGGFLD